MLLLRSWRRGNAVRSCKMPKNDCGLVATELRGCSKRRLRLVVSLKGLRKEKKPFSSKSKKNGGFWFDESVVALVGFSA